MFNVGDVVQLNSGGTIMTVSANDGANVQCHWFTSKGDLKIERFDPAMLKEAAPPMTLEELITASNEPN